MCILLICFLHWYNHTVILLHKVFSINNITNIASIMKHSSNIIFNACLVFYPVGERFIYFLKSAVNLIKPFSQYCKILYNIVKVKILKEKFVQKRSKRHTTGYNKCTNIFVFVKVVSEKYNSLYEIFIYNISLILLQVSCKAHIVSLVSSDGTVKTPFHFFSSLFRVIANTIL